MFDISTLNETTAADRVSVEDHTEPLYDLPFNSAGIGAFGISRPFINDRATLFVACLQETVYSLEIRLETGCLLVTKLAQFQNDLEAIFGGGSIRFLSSDIIQ